MNKTLIALFVLAGFCATAQERLTDVNADVPRSSFPQQFFNFNGEVYFLAYHTETGTEIWKSDGTADAGALLKDINLGAGSSVLSNFVEHNGKMYFVASDGIHGYQLWVSDGTAEGTQPVTNSMNSNVSEIASNGEF